MNMTVILDSWNEWVHTVTATVNNAVQSYCLKEKREREEEEWGGREGEKKRDGEREGKREEGERKREERERIRETSILL